jgi:pimeloyl-ACP methyl ester carboxylesterase
MGLSSRFVLVPAALAALPAAAEAATNYWASPEGPLAYDEVGSGPLVVCVPGMGDVRQEYRFLAPELVKAGFRVVTVDLRGHGESTTQGRDVSVAGVGADLAGLITALGGKAHVVGDSMAAGAAVWLAAERPELVGKLVLLGPAVRGRTDFWGGVLYGLLFGGFWGPDVWSAFYGSLYPTHKPADLAAYRKRLRANLAEPGRMAVLRRMIEAPKDASESRLTSVKAPTLVVMGSKDPDFSNPAQEARFIADAVGGTLVMVDGAGHYPHAEFPEVTAPLVVGFLSR